MSVCSPNTKNVFSTLYAPHRTRGKTFRLEKQQTPSSKSQCYFPLMSDEPGLHARQPMVQSSLLRWRSVHKPSEVSCWQGCCMVHVGTKWTSEPSNNATFLEKHLYKRCAYVYLSCTQPRAYLGTLLIIIAEWWKTFSNAGVETLAAAFLVVGLCHRYILLQLQGVISYWFSLYNFNLKCSTHVKMAVCNHLKKNGHSLWCT